ncbi:EscC/YscC/HrcC family type III secretion system outer membrane ring protein [Sphingomonas sp. So64.6b]|uniref:type III secretion system outer membrane ring subunit SctC n=1 Tax=Sphingomonas sp. So64.6b TaxID=2997354 RepID=UPI0016019ED1|nr:type III secretion system outer membrane ring subunit SctC [Sphingomonas sp. So64.6b]QNA86385.1 EscC/YscC/HrcC family type III secretion system outer membrane ring protein [Sphingomonas sp. So64.6b]
MMQVTTDERQTNGVDLPGKRAAMHAAMFALAMGSALPARAQDAVTRQSEAPQVSIVARDQPVGAFLRDLFGRAGRPVVPSNGLTGTVSGTFNGPIEKVFRDISKAFNFVGYYDGAALYIYSANELTVQTLPVGPAVAQRVLAQVRAQRLGDSRNILRAAGDGNLVASGTPRFIEQVTALSQGGSATPVPSYTGGPGPAPRSYGGSMPLEFRVFYLRYARAEDTLISAGGREVRIPGLATTMQNLVLDQRPGGSALAGTTQFGARLVRQSQPRLKGSGLDSVAPNIQQTPLLGLPTPGQYPGQSDVLGYGGGGEGVPLTQDVVRIEPSPYLNAVIVRDVPERMASYDSLVRALDVEPQLVEVEATIIDINTDKARDLGINWRFSSGGFGALFGNGTASDTLLSRTPGSRRDNVDRITPSGVGGTISTIIGSQREFLGRITALETKGVARVVSRPQLMTLSNVEAVFDRTRTFYVRVAGREEVDLFNVTAGTVMRVNPHVFRDHDQTRIRVLVNIEDGSISPTSRVQGIPIVDRASVSTQAMVLDGESLLLGGMTIDEDTDMEYKIPLLGDIPLLGNLFKSKSKRRGHTERLFLITPRVATLSSRLNPATVVSSTSTPATPMATLPLPMEGTK